MTDGRRDLTALAETSESESMFALVAGASPAIRRTLGIATERIGGGIATSVLKDSSNFWSKSLGLGVSEPVNPEVMDALADFYRRHGASGTTIQIAPSLLPPNWDDICAQRGITTHTTWVKLICAVSAYRPSGTTLRISSVVDDTAQDAALVIARGFSMAEDLVGSLYAPAFRTKSFQGFAAWDGGEIVAAAAMRVSGAVAEMYGAATLPSHRGRGAQSALLAARAAAAASAGCRWMVAETGVPSRQQTNSSLNNMLRAGFDVLYERRNWLWQLGA